MNLSELGEYKHKVAALLAQDDTIINLLLGPVDDDADTDEMLLGDKSISTGHIYEFEYVPEINETADTYLCMETVVAKAPSDTAYRHTGVLGTKADVLAMNVDRLLNGSEDFGIGKVRLLNNDVYKPNNNYYGRCITYEVMAFNRKMGGAK